MDEMLASGLPGLRGVSDRGLRLQLDGYIERVVDRAGHLRTFSGTREVDLIVETQDKRVVAIEVKLKRTIKDDDTRSLRWLQQTIGGELLDAIVITTGETAYRRPDGIGVVPAALLGP